MPKNSQSLDRPKSQTAYRTAWFVAAFVACGAWLAESDGYPFDINEARPTFYVYGWPLGFGYCGRARLPMVDFDGWSLAFDIAISTAFVVCSFFVAKKLPRRLRDGSRNSAVSVVFGIMTTAVIATGAYAGPLYRRLNVTPESSGIWSESRRIMPTTSLGLAILPMFIGWFCFGAVAFEVAYRAGSWLYEALRRRTIGD